MATLYLMKQNLLQYWQIIYELIKEKYMLEINYNHIRIN